MKTTSILICDSYEIVRFGVRQLLAAESSVVVAGEAATADEAVKQVARLLPDIALLEIGLDPGGGLKLIELLREAGRASIIVYTDRNDDASIVGAVRSGVQGYLFKQVAVSGLLPAIRSVRDGGTFFDRAVASSLARRVDRSRAAPADALSGRERQVLELLARGMSNQAIAEALFISQRTVKFHLSSIFGKLGAANRTEAVLIAARQALIELERAEGPPSTTETPA